MSVKTVCLDARLYGFAHTGIGRYVMNLIRYLPADPRIRIVLIVARENQNDPKLEKYPKYIARFHPYHPLSQLEMVWLWLRIRPDLLHVPHFAIPVFWPGKIVITIHDLIKNFSRGKDTTTHNPPIYWLKYLGYRLVLAAALHRAAGILVPAKYWQQILVGQYGIPPDRIKVTYEGVDEAISQGRPGGFKPNLPRPLVVYTGNLYPHKNIPVLLQAVKLFNGRVKLAIVCARSVFTARAEKLVRSFNLENDVFFLGRLSDSELVSLYTRADLFVFPSLIEGFGLPGLEAMAVGLPVIAARASCLPEIYRTAALYFDPRDPRDLQLQMKKLLDDPKLRSRMIARGLSLSKYYSWPKMAKITWAQYRTALL